ncbi:MAG TPA: TSUP family transporter [Stellaceae bacterium]|nr:TSUP family transporter [Stellaceae bacterium]
MVAASFVLCLLIVASGSALQAATGMGMALFAAPLLALLDPALVPGPALCAVMVLSAAVAWRERLAVDRRVLGLGLLGLAAGSALGAAVLVLLVGLDLYRLFAALILGAVSLSLAGLQIRATRLALLLGGTASGILGTLCGVQGPPIALVLQHEPPERLRATLCAFFAAGSLISLAALALGGVFGLTQAKLGLELLAGVPFGLAVAPFLARHIDRRRARYAVLTISTLSALALLLR